MDEEVFVSIEDFPDYAVSNWGRVIHTTFDREMTRSESTNGLTVGMVKDGRQYRRSIKVLVAKAFVPGETLKFNTPVILDGDQNNLHASNIVWRPRWFAHKYRRQFEKRYAWWDMGPVEDIFTGDVYPTAEDAAIVNGCLVRDVVLSMYNETRVYPNYNMFRMA